MKIWIVVVLAACSKEASTPSAGSATPGSGSAASTKVVEPPPAPAKLPEIKADHALILADKPGGKVAFTGSDGTKSELADGTIVDQTLQPQEDGAEITANGKPGKAAAEHVIGSSTVHPAPSGTFAVLTPEVGCGDYCHAAVWLVDGMTGGRWKLTDNAVNPRVAWRADDKAVAVDAGEGVAVIELPSGKQLAKLEHTYSPSYAPNGTLYVRGPEHEVFEIVDRKPEKVGQGKKPKLDEGEYPMPPDPVTFEGGKWKLGEDETPTKRRKTK